MNKPTTPTPPIKPLPPKGTLHMSSPVHIPQGKQMMYVGIALIVVGVLLIGFAVLTW